MNGFPEPPSSRPSKLPTVPPAGPFWRIWHPSSHTPTGTHMQEFGPLYRFDPHPPGDVQMHPGVFVLYGSMALEVSALEVFGRYPPDHRGLRMVDVCPQWRGSLINAPVRSRLFDLTSETTADSIGATVDLGRVELAGYGITQSWGRWFHGSQGTHGIRYLSCRAKDRGGIALALFRKAGVGGVHTQHRLIDDSLWPYVVWTLDGVDVVLNRIDSSECARCRS